MNLNLVPQVAPIMTAIVKITNQYGQQVVRPVNDVAIEFANIAGTQTLTKPTIEAMKRLGYTVEVQQDLPKTL